VNFWIAAVLLALTLGCAQTVALRKAPEVPAALGEAKITTDENNNTRIELTVEHLAPARNLTPPKSVYVVWAQAPEGRTMNLGQLVVGPDRRGDFRAVTPLKVFRIVITAEDEPLARAPSEQVVLQTDLFRTAG
jgi:hypothetical protein